MPLNTKFKTPRLFLERDRSSLNFMVCDICNICKYLLLKIEKFSMSAGNIGNKIKCDNEEVLQTY